MLLKSCMLLGLATYYIKAKVATQVVGGPLSRLGASLGCRWRNSLKSLKEKESDLWATYEAIQHSNYLTENSDEDPFENLW